MVWLQSSNIRTRFLLGQCGVVAEFQYQNKISHQLQEMETRRVISIPGNISQLGRMAFFSQYFYLQKIALLTKSSKLNISFGFFNIFADKIMKQILCCHFSSFFITNINNKIKWR